MTKRSKRVLILQAKLAQLGAGVNTQDARKSRPTTGLGAAGAAAAAIAAAAAFPATAATIPLTWLDMAPVPINTPVPNNTAYNMPGLGPVTITYSIPSFINHVHGTNAVFQNGNVVSGPDTYTWGAHQYFGATNFGTSNADGTPSTGAPWRITYTFPSTVAANQIYLGIGGLGRTTNLGGIESTATVNQNGTFLGDFISGQNWGATDFIPGAGTFTLRNTQIGAGGADPWWNTEMALIQINDSLNSLTVDFWNIPGDGLFVNIAYVPAPGAIVVLAAGGLVAIRRRR